MATISPSGLCGHYKNCESAIRIVPVVSLDSGSLSVVRTYIDGEAVDANRPPEKTMSIAFVRSADIRDLNT